MLSFIVVPKGKINTKLEGDDRLKKVSYLNLAKTINRAKFINIMEIMWKMCIRYVNENSIFQKQFISPPENLYSIFKTEFNFV